MTKRVMSTMFPGLFFEAASTVMELSQASAVTIGHRVPILMSVPFWPQADAVLEAHRMVTEKMAAAVEGTVAASNEAARLLTRAAWGRADATDMATGMIAIATAASQPARRRVHANARRLSVK